jgi:CheY-like chemotaxis protein
MSPEFHILLIEDSRTDVKIIERALREGNIAHRLTVFHDGRKALDFLTQLDQSCDGESLEPDLILLDLNLPKYDGRQLLEQIKSDADLCHIPVVVLTTSSAEEDVLTSYKLHANAYVTKPVDVDQFMTVVRQIDEFFIQVAQLPQS